MNRGSKLAFVAVSFLGVVDLLCDKLELVFTARFECAVKARLVSDVTLSGIDADLKHNTILVTVDKYLLYLLDMSGLFSLFPELFSRAAVVCCDARFDGLLQGLLVHISDHQYLAGPGVLGDSGNQTVGIEFGAEGVCFFDIFIVSHHFCSPNKRIDFNCQRLI